MSNLNSIKAGGVIRDRIRNFIADGYEVVCLVDSDDFIFAKLRHVHTLKIVVLQAYPCQNYFIQKSNGRVTIPKQAIL